MSDYTVTLDEIEGDEPWTAAEQRLIEEAHSGGVRFADEVPETATDENTIRAALIRHVVLGGCAKCRVSEKSVKVAGAWVTGRLDLEGCDTRNDLVLFDCNMDQAPLLRDAHLGAVYLSGSHMPGLDAIRLKTNHNIQLGQGFESKGPIDLSAAQIGGQFACSGGRFENPEGDAIMADSIYVQASLFFRDGFSAAGRVNLSHATIGGQVDCSGGTFENLEGDAIAANAISIGASLFLGEGFEARGRVNLTRAEIVGQVACIRGRFENLTGVALVGDSMSIGDSLFLSEGFSAKGQVVLTNTRIGGQMACVGGEFSNPFGDALTADSISIRTDLFLSIGFYASGRVDLVRADIGGNLICVDGTFDGGFDGEAMRVKAGFFWRGVEKVSGTINLTDAHVARLEDDLASWQMADKLILHGFRYDRTTGEMPLEERLAWLDQKWERDIPPGLSATVREFGKGDPFFKAYLPESYGKDFDPQPFTQLARHLTANGQPFSARIVRLEREKRERSAELRKALAAVDFSLSTEVNLIFVMLRNGLASSIASLFDWLTDLIKATVFFLLVFAFNWIVYSRAYELHQMAPTSDVVLTSTDWIEHVGLVDGQLDNVASPTLKEWNESKTAQDYTTFNAALYALDLFIPLDALGQEAAWAPSPARGLWGKIGFATGWITQMLGWVFTAITAAALTGFVGRKD
ncbi:hypothetical protein [Pelagimonas phthalicica]|nr:hypothetical protein [Pelagimonas phthalicica]